MEDSSSTYSIDDALSAVGFGKYQVLMLMYAGMGWVAEAMEMMLLSFVGPAVQAEWDLSAKQESMITSFVFVGMLVGAYSWGAVSDRFGRRIGFLVTALVTGLAGFLSSAAPNYVSLVALRCLVGAGLGGGHVLLSWFLEFVPSENRGFWLVVFSGFWTLGTVMEASLAWYVMPRLGWRWLLALSSFPSFVLLVFYCIVPESPRYLCTKGKVSEALQILERMSFVNRRSLPTGVLVSGQTPHQKELDDLTCPEDPLLLPEGKTAMRISENLETKAKGSLFLPMLFSRNLIKTTLLLWLVFFGHAFSYYGFVLLTSELISTNAKCAPTISQAAHSKDSNADNNLYKDVFITSFAEFPGLLIAAAAVDKVGRKLSMSSMLITCNILLIPLLVHQSQGLTTVLLFGARLFISGSFTTLYVYAPEVYPTNVRTTGVGAAVSVGRFGGIFCPLVAVALLHYCRQTLSILLFELVIFTSALAVLSFPRETKGCALSDTIN